MKRLAIPLPLVFGLLAIGVVPTANAGVINIGPAQAHAFLSNGVKSVNENNELGEFCLGCGTAASTQVTVSYSDGKASVSATGTSPNTSPGQKSDANAFVTFFFGVSGPCCEKVPIVVKASGSAQATPNADSQSNQFSRAFTDGNISVNDGLGNIQNASFCDWAGYSNPGCFQGSGANVSFTISVFPNLFGASITLIADGVAGDANFNTSVDPMVTFAPGFDSTGYSLVFSPDLPGTGTVPEPGSFVLLGSGSAFLAYFCRRARLGRQLTLLGTPEPE